MSWFGVLAELSRSSTGGKRSTTSYNPRPQGQLRPGAAPAAVLKVLVQRSGHWVPVASLLWQTGCTRKSVNWATHFLKRLGMIESEPDLASKSGGFRYRLKPGADYARVTAHLRNFEARSAGDAGQVVDRDGKGDQGASSQVPASPAGRDHADRRTAESESAASQADVAADRGAHDDEDGRSSNAGQRASATAGRLANGVGRRSDFTVGQRGEATDQRIEGTSSHASTSARPIETTNAA